MKLLSFLQRLGLAAGLSLVSLAIGAADFDPSRSLPDMGSSADNVLSLSEEQKLGEAFFRNTRGHEALVEDPELEEFIQNLGQQLISYLNTIPYDFTFFIIDSGEINAFAVPGGYIGINAGLIIAAQNENELASVIAHEIAHVTQRHISRRFEQSQTGSLLTLASIFAAILLADSSPDASLAALSTGMAGSTQAQLNYSRDHEQEADRVGIQLLANAGYDPRGMPLFFERLYQESRYSKTGIPEILLTHPITLNRIADAKSRAEQFPERGAVDTLEFQLMRAKLVALGTNSPVQMEQQYRQLSQTSQRPQYRYGYALLLQRNGNHQQAEHVLRTLIEQDKERVAYTIALAESQAQLGKSDQALALLQTQLELYPSNKGLTYTYSELLMKFGKAQQARKILDQFMRSRNPTPAVYKLRAQIENALGKQGESHAALAEYYYLKGRTETAVQHLEAAIAQGSDDRYRKHSLENRLAELKKIALEERKN